MPMSPRAAPSSAGADRHLERKRPAPICRRNVRSSARHAVAKYRAAGSGILRVQKSPDDGALRAFRRSLRVLETIQVVRTERLELSHLAAPEPKSGVSTNFTTSAKRALNKNARQCLAFSGIWGGRRGSNPRHQEPQSCALPTELRPPYYICLCQKPDMAHPAGLEPATIRLEGGCSIQLSYGRFCLHSIRSADLKLRL